MTRRYVLVAGDGRERDAVERARRDHPVKAPAVPDGFDVLTVLIASTAQIALRGLDVHGWGMTQQAWDHPNAVRNEAHLRWAQGKTTSAPSRAPERAIAKTSLETRGS